MLGFGVYFKVLIYCFVLYIKVCLHLQTFLITNLFFNLYISVLMYFYSLYTVTLENLQFLLQIFIK